MRRASILLNGFCLVVYAFLLAPILVVVGASFNSGNFLAFPPEGLSFRWYEVFFANEVFLDAIVNSLQIAIIATVVSCLIGTAAALYYVRYAGGGREWLRLSILSPLLLPEVLTAIALLFFVYEIGIGTDYQAGMIVGHILITLPFVFLNVAAAVHGLDPGLEAAARSLGASRWTAFFRITLPLIKPGVINGCLFAFIISFDTYSISFLLKDIGTSTLPLQLLEYLRFNFTPEAAAVSTVSVVMTLIVVIATEKLVGLRVQRF